MSLQLLSLSVSDAVITDQNKQTNKQTTSTNVVNRQARGYLNN